MSKANDWESARKPTAAEVSKVSALETPTKRGSTQAGGVKR
ncbi:MAG: hypothetical protein U0105_08390 [Candidatus Obscuribacterales bacterium]